MDPVVAEKIKFIKFDELKEYIDEADIPFGIGDNEGVNAFKYAYIPHTTEEREQQAARFNDEATKKCLKEEWLVNGRAFMKETMDWCQQESFDGKSRLVAGNKVTSSYVKLMPFIRAKSHYHRNGLLSF